MSQDRAAGSVRESPSGSGGGRDGLRDRSLDALTTGNASGLAQRDGVILNVASHAAVKPKTRASRVVMPYSVCKAGLRRLASDMAVELEGTSVSVVEVWPPFSRTEGVLAVPDVWSDADAAKPPLFTGRVVAALIAAGVEGRSGQAFAVTELAAELGGFVD